MLLPLLVNDVRCGTTEIDGVPRSDGSKDFIALRSGDLAAENILDVARESLAGCSGTAHKLLMEPLRYIADLDHPCHVCHMLLHVAHMFTDHDLGIMLPSNRRASRLTTRAGCSTDSPPRQRCPADRRLRTLSHRAACRILRQYRASRPRATPGSRADLHPLDRERSKGPGSLSATDLRWRSHGWRWRT